MRLTISSALAIGCAVALLVTAPKVRYADSTSLAALVGQDPWYEKDGECHNSACDACTMGASGNYGYCSEPTIYNTCFAAVGHDCGWVAMQSCGYWILCDPGQCPNSCWSVPDLPCGFLVCIPDPTSP